MGIKDLHVLKDGPSCGGGMHSSKVKGLNLPQRSEKRPSKIAEHCDFSVSHDSGRDGMLNGSTEGDSFDLM